MSKIYDIGLQRYREEEIRVCDSILQSQNFDLSEKTGFGFLSS